MEIESTKSGGGGNGSAGAVIEPFTAGLSPLSETIWRDRASRQEHDGDISAKLTWKDLTVVVAVSQGESRTVLDSLTGFAEPGSLTALMGPSGSGKSTLLDALSGRLAANAFSSGSILLNGRKTKLSFGTAVSASSCYKFLEKKSPFLLKAALFQFLCF